MDWEVDRAKVLHEGRLLKTAGGQNGEVDPKPSSAKMRYFRLVVHEGRDPPEFTLYYYDSKNSKSQKGHLRLDASSLVRMGWEDEQVQSQGSRQSTNSGAAAKDEAGDRSSLSRKASGFKNKRKNSGFGLGGRSTSGLKSRSSSGSMAQILAQTASKHNCFRIMNADRILFLLVPPIKPGGDSRQSTADWFAAVEAARSAARDAVIMKPTGFTSLANVQFDAESQTFAGVPEEMANDFVKAAFNLPLTQTTFVDLPGYGPKGIPLMLVLLKECLLKLDGHKEPGIFRIAPDKERCEMAKRAACLRNREDLEYVLSPHVFATLIKQWLRDMPGGLLNQLGSAVIAKCAEQGFPEDPAAEVLSLLDPVRRSIFLWLLDTLAMPVRHCQVTKMDSKNIAICVSPNLWESDEADDPMATLVRSQQLCKFMTNCLEWRMASTTTQSKSTSTVAIPIGGPPIGMAPPPPSSGSGANSDTVATLPMVTKSKWF